MKARAMILAAGFGSRLGDLTQVRPKPMLPVAGVPLVRWAALWLRHHGIEDVVVNLHHLGEQIEQELGDGSALGLRIQYSHEEGMILGTGGGLRHARSMLDDGSGAPIVVVNGKIMLGLDLHDTLAAHAAAGAEATMVLRPDPEATTWGSLQVDDRGRVVRLLQAVPDRDPEAQPVGDPLMFTGVQVLEPRFLDRVPPEGEQCVVRTAYRSLFHEGMGLHGYVTRDYWWEHSTPARYRQGVFNVLGGTFDPPFATAPVRGVHPEASVHPDAQIVAPVRLATGAKVEAGARVGPHVELGRGTVVKTGVTVQRAVVWDDAVVDADTSDAIVVP